MNKKILLAVSLTALFSINSVIGQIKVLSNNGGTSGYIPKWTGTEYIENGSMFNTTDGKIGIGTITPLQKLQLESGTLLINNNNTSTPDLIIKRTSIGEPIYHPSISMEEYWSDGEDNFYNKCNIKFHEGAFRFNVQPFGDPGYTEVFLLNKNLTIIRNDLLVEGTTAMSASNDLEKVFKITSNGIINFQVLGDGHVYAREVEVTMNNFPDYVFDKNYNLKPLSEVEAYINTNKHLPGVPTATEVEANGLKLGDMNKVIVEKIEELTLYVIDLQKQNNQLQKQNEQLQERITTIENK